MARLAAVTGLRFVHEGSTDEDPSDDRGRFLPELYGDRWAPVRLHELVGLSHVPTRSQLMYRWRIDTEGFGPGDLTGLARLGQGPCVPRI
ncbi:hypothetical protein ACI784_22205 [Geodermatophilus sp. SYSU D01186]